MSGEISYRDHFVPREQFYVQRESSFPIALKFIHVARQTKTNLNILEESIIDDRWNSDEHRILSEKCERMHANPKPKQTTTQGLHWQVTD